MRRTVSSLGHSSNARQRRDRQRHHQPAHRPSADAMDHRVHRPRAMSPCDPANTARPGQGSACRTRTAALNSGTRRVGLARERAWSASCEVYRSMILNSRQDRHLDYCVSVRPWIANFPRSSFRLNVGQPAGGGAQRIRQLRLVQAARNFPRAELGQMGGHELRVQQPKATQSQARDQMHQRDLGGVGDEAEHALAEERAAQRTPYSPPTSSPSSRHSTECAWPR